MTSLPIPPGTLATTPWREAAETAPPGWLLLRAAWRAVEPERGRYDDGVVAAMRRALPIARQRGVEPVVVLHAGSLPDWLLARDGWLDPDALSAFGCYVDHLARELGELLRFWIGVWAPMWEAGFYGEQQRAAARALVDAQSAAYLYLRRSQGYGGRPAAVGVVERWAAWRGEGLRGRAEAVLRERLGPDALVKVLATGRLAPPFSVAGELSNGTPAVDFVGVAWDGLVRLPDATPIGDDPPALSGTLLRLSTWHRPLFVIGGDAGAVDVAVARGVRVLAHVRAG